MRTDQWISRGIGATVCLLAVVVTVGYVIEPRDNLKELVLLLVGGLIGRLSTSSSTSDTEGVTTTRPGDTVTVEPAETPDDGNPDRL